MLEHVSFSLVCRLFLVALLIKIFLCKQKMSFVKACFSLLQLQA